MMTIKIIIKLNMDYGKIQFMELVQKSSDSLSWHKELFSYAKKRKLKYLVLLFQKKQLIFSKN